MHKIKKAAKVLFSKNNILEIPIEEIFKIAGESNIKTFAQIGSNDGEKNDPLRRYIRKNGWRGILVEPDLTNYKKLIRNYDQATGLIFENLGIGPEQGEMLFYKLRDVQDYEPDWYDQIGSFDKTTFIKNIEVVPGLIERMVTEPVKVISFHELLQKNNLTHVDLLHTDTEGFDYRILKSIDFKKYPAKIVLFEADWMTQYELREVISYLRGYDYRIFRCGIDYAGIKNRISDGN